MNRTSPRAPKGEAMPTSRAKSSSAGLTPKRLRVARAACALLFLLTCSLALTPTKARTQEHTRPRRTDQPDDPQNQNQTNGSKAQDSKTQDSGAVDDDEVVTINAS